MISRLLSRMFHPAATRRVLRGRRLHAFDHAPRGLPVANPNGHPLDCECWHCHHGVRVPS